MVSTAPRGPTGSTVARRPDVRAGRSLRSELADLYACVYGRTARCDTLDGLEDIICWLRFAETEDGVTLFRSMPQIFRAMGWPTTGRIREDRQRHRNRLANWLDMLVRLGVVEEWFAVPKANGEGRGILVRLRRDSSVGEALLALASARRPPRRPGRLSPPATGERPGRLPSCSSRVSPPLRENRPESAAGDFVPKAAPFCVMPERPSRVTRARRPGRSGCLTTEAAIAALTASSEEKGSDVVARLPWLVGVDPSVLARAAVVVARRQRRGGWEGRSLRISQPSRLMLEAAVEQLDRYDGRGAGAAAILDLAAGGWRQHVFAGRTGDMEAPRSPGALAKPLRQRARMARRAAELERC